MEFEAECMNDFEDGIEARASIAGQSFVEAFPGKAGIARDLRHSFGSGDVSECFGYKGRVSICFFKAGFEISGHFFRRSEMFGDVVARGFDFHSYSSSCFANRRATLMSSLEFAYRRLQGGLSIVFHAA
jgi:hypothetical protein